MDCYLPGVADQNAHTMAKNTIRVDTRWRQSREMPSVGMDGGSPNNSQSGGNMAGIDYRYETVDAKNQTWRIIHYILPYRSQASIESRRVLLIYVCKIYDGGVCASAYIITQPSFA